MDNMMATLAYDKADKTATVAEIKAFKLGGSYAIDAFKLNAIVEKATVASTPESKGTNVYLGGQYSLSATDAVKLAFAKKGNTTGVTDNAKQVTLGYDHGMSKRTSVYALYTKVTDNAVNAADPSTVSLGMKHAF
jgi:predicted porin